LLTILLGFRGWRAIRERGLKAATVGAQM
jgi:hypothetical protein